MSEANGQCEVLAKCERTTKLPQNAETGAPRADANDGEKAGVKLAKMLICTYSLFGGVKRRRQNQKFPSFYLELSVIEALKGTGLIGSSPANNFVKVMNYLFYCF